MPGKIFDNRITAKALNRILKINFMSLYLIEKASQKRCLFY